MALMRLIRLIRSRQKIQYEAIQDQKGNCLINYQIQNCF
jgi:hypothetical protein